jgi:hypothetical protein
MMWNVSEHSSSRHKFTLLTTATAPQHNQDKIGETHTTKKIERKYNKNTTRKTSRSETLTDSNR